MWLPLLILNYLLAWFSARLVARSWLDANAAGRWARLLCWVGAILAALGFTWCYLTLALAAAHYFGLVVATSVQLVAGIGGLVLTVLAFGMAALLAIYCHLRAARERIIRGGGPEQWHRYYGAALSGILRVTGRDREVHENDDPGTMIVLFALLATTAILGIVQTYLMIRSGVAETARQIAAECQQVGLMTVSK
jgi:hypothetical protein